MSPISCTLGCWGPATPGTGGAPSVPSAAVRGLPAVRLCTEGRQGRELCSGGDELLVLAAGDHLLWVQRRTWHSPGPSTEPCLQTDGLRGTQPDRWVELDVVDSASRQTCLTCCIDQCKTSIALESFHLRCFGLKKAHKCAVVDRNGWIAPAW